MFLRHIVLTHKNRQHFLCAIEMKSQCLKWKPISLM